MIARTTVSDLLLATAGALACAFGWKLGVGTVTAPDAGLMPFLVGLVLAALGLYGIVVPRALRASRQEAAALPPLFNNAAGWTFTVAAMIGLAVAVKFLTLAPAVFLFVFLLHAASPPRRLLASAVYAGVVAAIAWLVFVRGFGLSFA